jgi:hypothetical protein
MVSDITSEARPSTPTFVDSPRRWMLILARGILVIAGMIMLGVGAITALRESGIGITTVPILAGVLLVVSPFALDHWENLPTTPVEQSRLTRTVKGLGAPKTARILNNTDLARLADAYGFIHHALDGPQYRAAKLHLQDTLISRAAEVAMTSSFDPAEVHQIFRNGPPVVRAIALGLMDGDPALIDPEVVISAITDARSTSEQVHGLGLADQIWHRMTPEQRAALLDHVDAHARLTENADHARIVEGLRQRGIS